MAFTQTPRSHPKTDTPLRLDPAIHRPQKTALPLHGFIEKLPRDLMKDIRDGMTASQLMKKYKLSARAMRVVFRQLLDADAVTKAELDQHPTLHQCSIAGNLRRARRRRINFPLQIFDNGNPFKSGLVRDISEKGVCVEGIAAEVGDVKDFIIRSGNFHQGFSLVFEAGCRWVAGENRGARIVAGFEITNISALDSKELQRLLP